LHLSKKMVAQNTKIFSESALL